MIGRVSLVDAVCSGDDVPIIDERGAADIHHVGPISLQNGGLPGIFPKVSVSRLKQTLIKYYVISICTGVLLLWDQELEVKFFVQSQFILLF